MTESVSPGREKMYGEEMLLRNVMEDIHLSSIDVVHSVVGSVFEFTDYASQDDDITIICIKRNEGE